MFNISVYNVHGKLSPPDFKYGSGCEDNILIGTSEGGGYGDGNYYGNGNGHSLDNLYLKRDGNEWYPFNLIQYWS